ncbi:MAG: hypothetical protein ACTHK7_17175 [Aureliella sp.]
MNPSLDQPGYPERHHDVVRKAWRRARRALLFTGVPFVLLLAGTLLDVVHPAVTTVSAILFLWLGVIGVASSLDDVHRHAQVMPYFQRPVGDIDTFLAGKTLIRYLNQLDAAAEQLGVAPLSSFGFNDDLRGEQLHWHSPSQGLATVNALLQWLETANAPASVAALLRADLAKWRHALARAEAQSTPFCLLLRHCNATSGHEWEVRQGSAF